MDEQISTGQVAKKWGVIYGLITALLAVVPLILETQATWLGFLNIVIAIVIYVLATKEFKTANGGFMTFGEGFRISMVAAVICAGIRNVVYYAYVKILDPGITERMQDAMQDAWRDQGMSEEQIDSMQGFSAGFSSPEILVVMGIIFVLLGGLVWGSIVSAIIKNEAEDF